jgi:hypothetical protein
MRVHISYEVSKKLKEFLGESAPEPMEKAWYRWYETGRVKGPLSYKFTEGDDELYVLVPAYRLEDLLSRPFCEAFVKVGAKKFGFDEDEITDFVADWSTEMAYAYWNGGLEAVEAALMKMMDGEGA